MKTLKQILNGYQCEKCNTVYSNVNEALNCENKPMEQPLVKISDIFIDEYAESKFKIRISKIYYDRHEVCYNYEMYQDDEWLNVASYYGNEMLLEQLGDQINI
jgi:hypothetical protein